LSASAYVSAEILQDSKILFSLTAEDLKLYPRFCSALLLKICPVSIFQEFPVVEDFPKILPKIDKIFQDFPVEDFPRFSQDFAQDFQDSRLF
jgi:hypothetical protein